MVNDPGTLANRHGDPLRVLVLGASSGIGAATANALVHAGARVTGAARRRSRVEDLDGVIAVSCDVRDSSSCDDAVSAAAKALGGLDAFVYATGTTGLTPLDADHRERWLEIFSTNIFGAAQVTRAALPHLQSDASDGHAVFLTSDSAVKPYPGLVAYGASKAALSAFCQGLAAEHSSLRVTEVVVGPTIDTEVGQHFDPEEFGYWFERWCDEGFVRYGYQVSEEVASVIVATLASDAPEPLVLAAAEGT